jgi:hypothetical protein
MLMARLDAVHVLVARFQATVGILIPLQTRGRPSGRFKGRHGHDSCTLLLFELSVLRYRTEIGCRLRSPPGSSWLSSTTMKSTFMDRHYSGPLRNKEMLVIYGFWVVCSWRFLPLPRALGIGVPKEPKPSVVRRPRCDGTSHDASGLSRSVSLPPTLLAE